jgi:hypothetical protein
LGFGDRRGGGGSEGEGDERMSEGENPDTWDPLNIKINVIDR